MDLSKFPYCISYLYKRIEEAKTGLEKIIQIKDTFEVYSRFVSYILISEYISNKLNKDVKGETYREALEKLITFSSCSWKDLIFLISQNMKTTNIDIKAICNFFYDSYSTIYYEILEDFSQFRNEKIGHGTVGLENENRELAQKWLSELNILLEKSIFLYKILLIVPKGCSVLEIWNGIKIEEMHISDFSFITPENIETLSDVKNINKFYCYFTNSKYLLTLHPLMIREEIHIEKIGVEIFMYDSDKDIGKPKRHRNVYTSYIINQSKVFADTDESKSAKKIFLDFFGEEIYIDITKGMKAKLKKFKAEITEFDEYIARHGDIIGRNYLKNIVKNRISENKFGFIIIYAKPGVGKSAFIAKLSREEKDGGINTSNIKTIIFFIDKNSKILSSPISFLKSLYEQIINLYKIIESNVTFERTKNIDPLEPESARLKAKLLDILYHVSEKNIVQKEKLVILVDGLDEAFSSYVGERENIIDFLPVDPIKNVLFVITSRLIKNEKYNKVMGSIKNKKLLIDIINIESNEFKEYNIKDSEAYLENRILNEDFLEREYMNILISKSEYNFLYLKMIADDINKGLINIDTLLNLPKGLGHDFFNIYLARMCTMAEELGIIEEFYTLLSLVTATREAISFDSLQRFTGYTIAILERFIYITTEYFFTEQRGQNQKEDYYKIYHNSFREFLIYEFDWDIILAHRHISDYYLYVLNDEDRIEDELDDFCIRNLFYHLYEGKGNYYRKLLELIDEYREGDKDSKGYRFFQNHLARSYDEDVLNDILLGVNIILKIPDSETYLYDIAKYGFHYADTKEEMLKDLDKIFDWCKQGDWERAKSRARIISNEKARFYELILIAYYMLEYNAGREAIEKIFNEIKEIPNIIVYGEWWHGMDIYLLSIINHFIKNGYNMFLELNFDLNAGKNILLELVKQNNLKCILKLTNSIKGYTEPFSNVWISNCDRKKSIVLKEITINITKTGDFDKALIIANNIGEDSVKSEGLKEIAAIIAKSGDFDKALMIANSIGGNRDKSSALTEIAVIITKAGDNNRANTLFNKAIIIANSIDNDWVKSEGLKEIATIIAKAGDFDKARKITNMIVLNHIKSDALKEIAAMIAKSGDFDKALMIAKRIEDNKVKSEGLKEIAINITKTGDFNKTIDVANSIEENKIKSDALKEIAAMIAKSGDFDKAIDVANSIDGIWKSEALEEIAVIIAKSGNYDKAINVANSIGANETKSYGFKEIAVIIAKAGDFDKARKITNMIVLNHRKSDALKEIAAMIAKSGDFDKAIDVANSIDDIWKSEALEEIAIYLKAAGDFDKAIIIANSIEENWIKFDVLGDIANIMAKAGDFDKAIIIANSIGDNWIKSCVLGDIACIIAETGDISKSNKLFNKAIKASMDIKAGQDIPYSLKKIATNMANTGNVNRSNAIFNKAIEAAKNIHDDYNCNKYEVLKDIAISIAMSLNFNKAIQLLNFISKDREKSSAIIEISNILVKTGNFNNIPLFNKLINIAKSIEFFEHKLESLSEIAVCIAKIGDIKQANIILNEAIDLVKNNKDKSFREEGLVRLIENMTNVGKFDQAIELTKVYLNEDYRYSVLETIAISIAGSSDYDKAIKLVNSIDEDCFKISGLIKISNIMAETGQIDKADKLLKKTIQVAMGIKDNDQKLKELCQISSYISDKGDLNNANTILNKAIEIAMEIKEGGYGIDTEVLTNLSLNIAKTQDFDKALKVANLSKEGWERSDVLSKLICIIAKSGDDNKIDLIFTEIIKNISKIENDFVRDIAINIAESKYIDKAIEVIRKIEDDRWKAYTLKEIAIMMLTNQKPASNVLVV